MRGFLRLGRIAGIPVSVHWTLGVIAWFLGIGLATGALPASVPHASTAAYWATAAMTGSNCSTKARINRTFARTTWAGTGNCGGRRTAQSSPVRASVSRCARAHRCHWRSVNAVSASGVG